MCDTLYYGATKKPNQKEYTPVIGPMTAVAVIKGTHFGDRKKPTASISFPPSLTSPHSSPFKRPERSSSQEALGSLPSNAAPSF